VRAAADLGPVTADTNGTRMAFEGARVEAHLATVTHALTPGMAFFTTDAQLAAGNSDIAPGPGNACDLMAELLSGPYHGRALLDPTLSSIGIGFDGTALEGGDVLLTYFGCCPHRTDATALSTTLEYPTGSTFPEPNRGEFWAGGEIPNPLANCPAIPPISGLVSQVLGPIIYEAAPNANADLTSVSASVTKNGAPMTICTITSANDVNVGFTSPSTVFILGEIPFGSAAAGNYNVSISWTDGTTHLPGSTQWSFSEVN
jgi:hypothetical protein